MANNLDNFALEVVGKNWLVSELLKAGFQTAVPSYDKGIDLIAFRPPNKNEMLKAVPLQLKVSKNEVFSLNSKYSECRGLLLVYIWHTLGPHTECFALRYNEAFKIMQERGYTRTASWKVEGEYTTNKPSAELKKTLKLYKCGPNRWARLFKTS